MEILSRFRDLFTVCPVGEQVRQGAAQFGKLREYLRKEMTLEYFVHGSCSVGSGGMTLILHFEYLPRQELIFSSKVDIDAADLSELASKISSQCVIPIISHLQRNETESWDAFRSSEDEQAFREAQKLVGRRALGALDQARRMLVGILERCGEIGNVYVALARAEHTHGQLLGGPQFVEALEKARVSCQESRRDRRSQSPSAWRAGAPGPVSEKARDGGGGISARPASESPMIRSCWRTGRITWRTSGEQTRLYPFWRTCQPAGRAIRHGSSGTGATPSGC